jgi:hypothetical protein
MPVVALADHVEIQPEAVHVELPGARQGKVPSGRM